MDQKQLFEEIMTDVFPELIKYVKPKVHKKSTKGKEKILKISREKDNLPLKSDLHTSQQWKRESSGMFSVMK